MKWVPHASVADMGREILPDSSATPESGPDALAKLTGWGEPKTAEPQPLVDKFGGSSPTAEWIGLKTPAGPTLSGPGLVSKFVAITEKMADTTRRKYSDYAGANGARDAFANLRMVETFGVLTTEQGIFTRMSDKFARLASFLANKTLKVKDESIEDTLLDLANYCILLVVYLRHKSGKA
jgi:hypothetical protein